jgi:hypothetical protein
MIFLVFLQIPKHDIQMLQLFYREICKYRFDAITDLSIHVRLKQRIAAFVSYFGLKASYCIGKQFGRGKHLRFTN